MLVWCREQIKSKDQALKLTYAQITRISDFGCDAARTATPLGGLHVDDLRHAAGTRLREAGVSEETVGGA